MLADSKQDNKTYTADIAEESSCVMSETTKKANNIVSESGLKWPEEMIYKMIHLWRERELLYNTKHMEYSNKISRRMAMAEIAEELNISVQEILGKMVSLRTYYGTQHRKKIEWEKKGYSSYRSRWHFFNDLEFLQDFMSQKHVEPLVQPSVTEDFTESQHSADNNDISTTQGQELETPQIQPRRKRTATKKQIAESEAAERNQDTTNEISEGKKVRKDPEGGYNNKSEDELFTNMLMNSLSKIREGEAKEALKLEIQNLVFKTRFGSQKMSAFESGFENGYRQGSPVRPVAYSYGHSANDCCYEETTTQNRRKATHPQRSKPIKNSPEDYSMVSVHRNNYGEQETVDVRVENDS